VRKLAEFADDAINHDLAKLKNIFHNLPGIGTFSNWRFQRLGAIRPAHFIIGISWTNKNSIIVNYH